jgi:hypothetical protein
MDEELEFIERTKIKRCNKNECANMKTVNDTRKDAIRQIIKDVRRDTETVNVSPQPKLSKQQKFILKIIEEHNGAINQRRLTRLVAEKKGEYKHISKQDAIDHAVKTIREAEGFEHKRLLSLLLTSNIRNMPRRGRHYVTESGRASVCRSIRRLEERGLVDRTFWGNVYLVKNKK